ncbi:MAG: RelA/SpoT family protein [Spirochaetota bacterium]
MVETLGQFEEKLALYGDEDRKRILAAGRLSRRLHEGQFRESGAPYYTHPLQVAEILVDLRLDATAVQAALLHDVLEDTGKTRQELRRQFGREVELLVNGVTKIASVKAQNKNTQEVETIRKMLFAMVKDIRVILIKLADKLHNMRTLEHKSDSARRKEIAQECLDIYAPLAGRLGISWIKDELEDLSLKHLNPRSYEHIKAFVAQKKEERANYLSRVERAIVDAAREVGLKVEVETRAKHFYSIYQKIKRRNKSVGEIFDLLGIRILVEDESACYSMLGVVHGLWPPIEGRFKDYIAMPKANRYQSLHTTVLCYEGKMIEIQIRSHAMHRTAEFGVAAHWVYKTNPGDSRNRHKDLQIIHRVKDLNGQRITSSEFLEEIKRELLKDTIYVFTPKGDAVELPRGATAIDFAYHIHTEVGNHTAGAKADGSIIPLKTELKNTQVIEIMTSPQAHPHLSWLRYVKTGRARSKIRHWLNRHDESLIIDQSVVARRQIDHPHHAKLPPKAPPKSPNRFMDKQKVGVRIGNERNVMIRFAQCCNPTTGDDIIGYISRGRGIVVHRRNCPNLRYISDLDERTIEVEWETVSPRATRRFKVTAHHTSDLFSEIEGAVRKVNGHLIEGRVEENLAGNLEACFTLELDRREDVKKLMKRIRTVPSVMNIQDMTAHNTEQVAY